MILLGELFGWIVFVSILLLMFSFVLLRRKERCVIIKQVLLFFSRYHKQIGILVLLVMFLHGKLMGQRPDVLAILCLLFTILLFISNVLHKTNRSLFIFIHKILAIILFVLMILHILFALF